MQKPQSIKIARAVAFGILGIVFIYTSIGMPMGLSRTVWVLLGAADLLYAAWIVYALLHQKQ